MSSLSPDLLVYATNLFHRFPEEFLALGRPGLEDVFDCHGVTRSRSESMFEKTIAIHLPRRCPPFHTALPAPWIACSHRHINDSSSDTIPVDSGNGAFGDVQYQASSDLSQLVSHKDQSLSSTPQQLTSVPSHCEAFDSALHQAGFGFQGVLSSTPQQLTSVPSHCEAFDSALHQVILPSKAIRSGQVSSDANEAKLQTESALDEEPGWTTPCHVENFSPASQGTGRYHRPAAIDRGSRSAEAHNDVPSHVKSGFCMDGSSDSVVEQSSSSETSESSDCEDSEGISSMPSITFRARQSSVELDNYFSIPQRLRSNTVLVFDWDDTLFPTTWLADIMKLDCRQPCPPFEEYLLPVAALEAQALDLLDTAMRLARTVAIVTLARQSWVEATSRNFCPRLADALTKHKIPIIYAREFLDTGTGTPVHGTSSTSDRLAPYYHMKANAIAQLTGDNTPLHPLFGIGGVWGANVISIGDGEFELEGVQRAISRWNVRHHRTAERLPRTKTVKMLDEPVIADLEAQLRTITSLAERMVRCDAPFNLKLVDAARRNNLGKLSLDEEYIESFMADLGAQDFSRDALLEERFWKPKSDEDPKHAWHWLPRRMWLSRAGQLWYDSMKAGKPTALFDGLSVAKMKIRIALPAEVVGQIQGVSMYALAFEMPEGHKSPTGEESRPTRFLAVESDEARSRCLDCFASVARLQYTGRVI